MGRGSATNDERNLRCRRTEKKRDAEFRFWIKRKRKLGEKQSEISLNIRLKRINIRH